MNARALWRLSRWPLGVALGLVALSIAALLTVAGSEMGSRWVVTRALSMAAPEARIDRIEGTLARGLALDNLVLPLGGADIHITQVRSRWNAWNLLGGQFPVERLAITSVTLRLSPGDPDPHPPGPWPSLALPFPVSIADGQIRDLRIHRGEEDFVIPHIALAARGGVLHTRIHELAVTTGDHRLRLRGRVGNRAPYPLHLTVEWSAALADGQTLAGRGTLSGDLGALRLEHQLEQPSALHTKARLSRAFAADRMALDLEGLALSLESQWLGLQLRLPGLPVLASDGHLAVTGNWADYHIELGADVADPAADGHPDKSSTGAPGLTKLATALLREPGRITLSARGQGRQLQLAPLTATTRAGQLEASGGLALDTPLRWNLALVATDLDTGLLEPSWPARLSARVESDGEWQGDDYRISLRLTDLSGKLLDAPLTGLGSATLRPGSVTIAGLALSVADNRLEVDGSLTEHLDLRWLLAAPRLADLGLDLGGAARSTGTLTGTLARPSGHMNLAARDLHYRDQALEQLALTARADQDGTLHLDLQGRGIAAGPLIAATLSLQGRGQLEDHELRLALDDGDSHLALALDGGFEGNRWQGLLRDSQLSHPRLGDWRQNGTADLAASPGELDLDTLCLTRGDTTLCGGGHLADQRLTAEGRLDQLPAAALATALPGGTRLDGMLAGRFRLRGPLDALDGELSLTSSGLHLHYLPGPDVEALDFAARLDVRATLVRGGADAWLDFALPGVGSLDGHASLSRLTGEGALSGTLAGRFSTLTWLDGLFPQLDNLDGTLAIDLSLAGQLAMPRLTGALALEDLGAQLPLAGIELVGGRARLGIDGDGRWQLGGAVATRGAEAAATSGTLRLDGGGVLGTDQAMGLLQLRGEDVLVVDRPDARARLSPDLRLTLDTDAIELDGDLAITSGHFILGSLPERAVEVSPDEQIFPAGEEVARVARPLRTRVRLHLDDSFRFEGRGLVTRVGGNLRLSQQGDDPPRAVGTLTLVDGVYAAYGQSLAVERGYVIFQGPLDNPGLNIRAVRKTPAVTVGITIGGVAKDIRSELFSTPPRTPTDTLAILITGKPPGGMNASDANQVVNAAAALGIAQSDRITGNLQQAFGLDVVDVRGGDDYLDSALVVGKYLTPELFISYVQNLFTPAGSIQLDYNLTRHLGLKASSGETQSLDLLYRIEH